MTDSYYDSPPPKPAIFFDEGFIIHAAAPHNKEGYHGKKKHPFDFLCANV